VSEQDHGRKSDPNSRPVPDPTVLTTAQLQREIAGVDQKIAALKDLTESDLEGLEAVVAEKFNTVDTQFALIERQRVEQKIDSGNALAAALAAAKEAVTKNEEATKEQLAQLKATFDTAIKGVTDLLSDLRDRVGKIENLKQGGSESRAGLYAALGGAVAFLGLTVVAANYLSGQ
jgi:chromosome segregation ATPase